LVSAILPVHPLRTPRELTMVSSSDTKVATMMRWLAVSILFVCVLPVGANPAPRDVKGDRVQFLHELTIQSDETANVVQCFGCNVYVRGHATGDIITVGGSVYIEGTVDGDALAAGGHIEVGSGGELKGGAVAVGGYVTTNGQGVIGRDRASMPYALLPGQYRPTAIGFLFLLALNLICVAVASLALRPHRVDNTARAIWYRKGSVVFAGASSLLLAWGLESMSGHLGRAQDTADMILGVFVVGVASAGAPGLGRMVGGIAFPNMSSFRATLAGIFALTFIELVPLLGFAVLTIGLLLSLGAGVVSRFGSRAVPMPEQARP
jgi:hypothetical protein